MFAICANYPLCPHLLQTTYIRTLQKLISKPLTFKAMLSISSSSLSVGIISINYLSFSIYITLLILGENFCFLVFIRTFD